MTMRKFTSLCDTGTPILKKCYLRFCIFVRAEYAAISSAIHTYIENTYNLSYVCQIQKDKMNTLVIVPLYPQYSISTSGSSLKLLEEIFYKDSSVWGPHAGTYSSSLLPNLMLYYKFTRKQYIPYTYFICVCIYSLICTHERN